LRPQSELSDTDIRDRDEFINRLLNDAISTCGEALEQFLYGFSILHCLPAGMADQPSAATGTVMRPGILNSYAMQAGFSRMEILPIENFFFRFYRLWR